MESIEGLQFMRFILALGIVLAGLGVFAYIGKRVLNRQGFGHLKSGKNLRILEEMSLAQQRRLLLIDVNQAKVLLLLSAKGDYIQVIPNREGSLHNEKK